MIESFKKYMKVSIWGTVILFSFRCWLGQGDLSMAIAEKKILECCYSLFGYAGEAIGVTVLFMAGFNKWFWKWKPLAFLAGGMPILAKKYKGAIRYNLDDDKVQECEAEVEIGQTFLNIMVKFETAESISNSVTATIKEENGVKMLIYTYLNTPRGEIQGKSSIHYGTAMLTIDDPKHLIGNYYTTRLSRGSLELVATE